MFLVILIEIIDSAVYVLLVERVISPDYGSSLSLKPVLKVQSSKENAVIRMILKFPQHSLPT